MTIWIQDCGFDSAGTSYYGREMVWKEDNNEQKGRIIFVTSHGAVLVRTLEGESKLME
jgi:hypothetical protein